MDFDDGPDALPLSLFEPFRGAAEPDGKPLFTPDPLSQPLDRFHPPQFTSSAFKERGTLT
jgi:hypothetical protein